MGLHCGIVGLPNVGKSTLFNALSQAGADCENYPFCTIEPNVGVVPVPDDRVYRLAELAASARAVPTTIEFVDIAGLVAGASRGEGLGNQFLAHIREVDAIIHLVRCFEDENVVHVTGAVDPVRDIEIVQTELLLKDLETVTKRLEKTRTAAKSGEKKIKVELAFYERLAAFLDSGSPARLLETDAEETEWMQSLFLLSVKPTLFVANVAETDLEGRDPLVSEVREMAEREGSLVVPISAELEAQISELEEAERGQFLEEMGLHESGLDRLIHGAYELLDLVTFFTANFTEAHAWTVKRGTTAVRAAGTIHTDFERGFIRAEMMRFEDYDCLGSEHAVREAGLLRSEGRDYVVQDGDVLLFRFNV